jgi:glycosyltransferase involved in cell wall biosynthesis
MSRLRTGIVGYEATSLEVARRSGVSQYTARLLKALIERREGWSYQLLNSRRLCGVIPEGALHHVTLRFPNKTLWMQVLLPLILSRLRLPLCHFTNYLAPLKAPCPYVVTIHDMSLFIHGETHTRKSLWSVRSLLPLVAHRADAIIAVSESARRDIVSVLRIPTDKVRVIHEAAGEEYRLIDQPGELQRVAATYGLQDPFILSVGTLEPRKNLRRLLSAHAKLRQAGLREKLLLVGQLGWKYRGVLSEIERLGLQDSVRVQGYVPDADLPAIYNLAKALAFPSLYEGFGLPILEAMACGTPVLTSDCSSLPEVAGDAAVLVDPCSQESLSEGLHRILRDAQLREQLRAAGFKRAAQFSWSRAAEETSRLYRSLADRQQP